MTELLVIVQRTVILSSFCIANLLITNKNGNSSSFRISVVRAGSDSAGDSVSRLVFRSFPGLIFH